MKKALLFILLFCVVLLFWCNQWSNDQFNNTLKCQEFKNQFLNEMVDYFAITSFSSDEFWTPLLAPLKNSIELFYSPITNSCLWIAYGDYIERNKFDPNDPDWTNKVDFSESLYVVQDVFNSNRCRVKSNEFYDDGILEEIEFYNDCQWLPAYDDNKFSMFEFNWDDVDKNLGLAKEIFRNEINFLKWNK